MEWQYLDFDFDLLHFERNQWALVSLCCRVAVVVAVVVVVAAVAVAVAGIEIEIGPLCMYLISWSSKHHPWYFLLLALLASSY